MVDMPSKPEIARLRRSGKWIVWGLPWPTTRWCGPYETRKDAEGDDGLRGIRNAVRYFKKGEDAR